MDNEKNSLEGIGDIKNEQLEGQIVVDDILNSDESIKQENTELTYEKEEKKTKGLKLTKKTIAELDVLQGKFGDAEDLIKTLISNYRTQRIKENGYEDRAKDLDQFNYLIDTLKILFTNSLEIERTTTARVDMEYKEKIQSLTKSIAKLTEDQIKSKEEFLSVIEEHRELKIENEEYIKQLDLIQNMLNGKEKELVQCKEQINMLSGLLTEYKAYKELNKELNDKLIDLEKDCDAKKSEVTTLSNKVLILEKDIENLNLNITGFKERVYDNKLVITELKEENKAIKSKEETAKNELNNKLIELTESKYKIKELTNEVNLLKTELNNKSSKVNSLEKAIIEKDVKVESLLTELNSVKSQLTVWDKGYEDYESKYIDRLQEKDEEIDNLKRELEAVKTKRNKSKKSME